MARLFKRVFGDASIAGSAPSLTTTLVHLREQMATLEKREAFLQKRCQGCTERARAALAVGDRRTAMRELKMRRLYTTQLAQLDGMTTTLFVQASEVEKALLTQEQLRVLDAGVKALKGSRGGWTVDKVETLTEEIQEALQDASEIQDALSRPLVEVDTDELDAELDAMMAAPPSAVPPYDAPVFPRAPTEVPVKNTDAEEQADIEAMRMSMMLV
jgi:hypothetical protein